MHRSLPVLCCYVQPLCSRLPEKEVADLAKCIQLDMECAAIWEAPAKLMSMNGSMANELCQMCIDICNRCAEECENHGKKGMEHSRECAEACRKCAEVCLSMIKALTGIYSSF